MDVVLEAANNASWALTNTQDLTNSWLTLTWETASWTNIEEVAMQVKSTPDTWTKTNILLLLTLGLTLALFLVRKKSFKV